MTSPDLPKLCERLEEHAEWAGTTDHGEELYMTAEAGLALAADLRSAASTIRELISERDALRVAISWIEPPFVDDATPEAELRNRVRFVLEDARKALESSNG